jgi:ribosomal protein L40E
MSKEVRKDKHVCRKCGAEFPTSQTLGSHLRYKHKENRRAESERESLDLKEDFLDILRDVGLKNRAATITDIFF